MHVLRLNATFKQLTTDQRAFGWSAAYFGSHQLMYIRIPLPFIFYDNYLLLQSYNVCICKYM